jgi:hypothetical protein
MATYTAVEPEIPIDFCPRCNQVVLVPKQVTPGLLRPAEVRLVCPKCQAAFVKPLNTHAPDDAA